MKIKRLIIASLLGLVFGFVCNAMAASGPNELPLVLSINIIMGRLLIGFGIGISRFSFKHWTLHGLVMGLIFSLPAAFGTLLAPENPEFSHERMFIATMVMGMIYGLLIELITTVFFKAKQ